MGSTGDDGEPDGLEESVEEDSLPLRRESRIWPQTAYLAKEAKEILNDLSFQILRDQPDWVEDPHQPTMAELLKYQRDPQGAAIATLSDLLAEGLDYQEAVHWYFFRYCGLSIMEIYYAAEGCDTGGGVEDRRNASRSIRRSLHTAAQKLGEDVDIPHPDNDTEESDT